MASIGPEVTALQLRGAQANVGLSPAQAAPIGGGNQSALGGGHVTGNQESAPLTGAGQRSIASLIQGFADPARLVQPNNLGSGYAPQWKNQATLGLESWSAQMAIYDIYALAPVDNRGPGDNPVGYLVSVQPPVVQNFAMRWQGMPVSGGNLLMTGLYAPLPIGAPNSP